jgi:hypothetical protein
MLPTWRTASEGSADPMFDVVPSDVKGFMEEWWEFQSTFRDCFVRNGKSTGFRRTRARWCEQGPASLASTRVP